MAAPAAEGSFLNGSLKGEASLLAFEAHKARKQAEEDAIKLQNRVRKLHLEKEKAEKLIEQTRKKADELAKIKARNDQQKREKDALRAERNRQTLMQKLENQRRRQQLDSAKAAASKSLHDTKRHIFSITREERKMNEDYVDYSRQQDLQQNIQRKNEIRSASLEKDAKIRQKMQTIEHMALEDAARRRYHEQSMKEAVEAELARLAAMEAQLIEGLKAQQAEQALALEALEAELGTSRRLSNTGSRRGAKSNGGSLTNTLRLPIRDSPEPQPLGSSLTRSKNL